MECVIDVTIILSLLCSYEKGYLTPSRINHYLDAKELEPMSDEFFAPQFPTSMIAEMIALCLLHVRCIERLMEQQRELFSRYLPLGFDEGAQVTCEDQLIVGCVGA